MTLVEVPLSRYWTMVTPAAMARRTTSSSDRPRDSSGSVTRYSNGLKGVLVFILSIVEKSEIRNQKPEEKR
jgi:hypothetical protein